jgi:hypothetical protein
MCICMQLLRLWLRLRHQFHSASLTLKHICSVSTLEYEDEARRKRDRDRSCVYFLFTSVFFGEWLRRLVLICSNKKTSEYGRERERERSRVYFVISNGYKYICVYSHELDYHAAVPETVPYMYVRMCLGNSSIKFGWFVLLKINYVNVNVNVCIMHVCLYVHIHIYTRTLLYMQKMCFLKLYSRYHTQTHIYTYAASVLQRCPYCNSKTQFEDEAIYVCVCKMSTL